MGKGAMNFIKFLGTTFLHSNSERVLLFITISK